MLTLAKYERLCIAKFAGKQGQFGGSGGRPEVGNGGSEDDPVSSEHILPDSQVHVAQFSLPSDVLHLHNYNDSLKAVDGLTNLRKTEVWQILLVENCGI